MSIAERTVIAATALVLVIGLGPGLLNNYDGTTQTMCERLSDASVLPYGGASIQDASRLAAISGDAYKSIANWRSASLPPNASQSARDRLLELIDANEGRLRDAFFDSSFNAIPVATSMANSCALYLDAVRAGRDSGWEPDPIPPE